VHSHALRSGLTVLASCLCLVSGLRASDASGADLVGKTSATLAWAPASGPVRYYGVYVARNGGPFTDEPELTLAATATVNGDYGDSVVVRVAAFDALSERGPFSDPTEAIRFVAPAPAPDPAPDPTPDPDPTPETDPEPDSVPAADPRLACEDFDADGRADFFWSEGGAGPNEIWLSSAAGIMALAAPDLGDPGFELATAGDFDGDGHGDLFWVDPATGDTVLWLMRDGELAEEVHLDPMDSSFRLVGAGDQDVDGRSDLVWYRQQDGAVQVWLMRGSGAPQVASFRPRGLNGWNAVAVGDHDGDGRVDVYWRELFTGENKITLLGSRKNPRKMSLPTVASTWVLAGAGDTDGDGRIDLVWRDPATGDNAIWLRGRRDSVREELTDASRSGS
jgi:hypothetical protein